MTRLPPSVPSITQPSMLFNKIREMQIVCVGESRDDLGKRVMKLKIYERTLDNNEREIRTELTCPTDDDFIYAGGVTKSSYQNLKDKFELAVDFDHFAHVLIEKLSPPSDQVDIRVRLSNNRSKCDLQLFIPGDLNRRDLPLELHALEGDELLTYLKSALRAQRNTSYTYHNAREILEKKVEELSMEIEKRQCVYNDNERLREDLERTRDAAEDHKMDLNQVRQMYEAMCDENKELKGLNKELDEDLEEALQMNDDIEEEKAKVSEEVAKWRNKSDRLELDILELNDRLMDSKNEISSLRSRLRKAEEREANEKLRNFVKGEVRNESTRIQSIDDAKLRELEEDLKEKTEIVEKMIQSANEQSKRLEESESARALLEESNRQLQIQVERSQKLVDLYRRPPTTPSSSTQLYNNSSPLSAYSTPPTVPNVLTPSAARIPPLGSYTLQQRGLIAPPLSRPLTPLNGRKLNHINGTSGVIGSPKILSYTAPSRANPHSDTHLDVTKK